MKTFQKNTAKGLALSVSALALVVGAPALAQDAEEPTDACALNDDGSLPEGCEDEETVDITTSNDGAAEDPGSITVTGSRIVRDTYSSISPLQVITSDSSRNAGLFDPSQILQRDEAAAGTQIDSTFVGFVLDNGPGNQTVNLRGLGASRTLLLINGRRLAPSGVGGAPTAPSTNLLPSSLIENIDLLLDGASSVYGSDAVAGVANVVLRNDFDGLELFGSGTLNPNGAGEDYTVSASWGFNTDRGFFGIGAEYDYRDRVAAKDRDFLAGCETQLEINQNGDIFTTELTDQIDTLTGSGGAITVPANECARIGQGLRGSIIEPFGAFGVLYYTPGETNAGVPNFSESSFFFTGAPVDANGDGIRDITFADYSTNGEFTDLELIPEQERINVMAYGEYTFPGEANITPFFEAMYSRVDINARTNSIISTVVSVPDNNEFNPCNPFRSDGQGVDCFNQSGVFNIGGPFIPGLTVPQPVISRSVIDGDRNNFTLDLEQYRGVLGVRGDLPFVGPSWTFEVAGTYTRSVGKLFRQGIREDKLAFSIGIDPTRDFNGDGIVDNDGDGIADDYDPSVDFGASPLLGLPSPINPCDASQLANPELAAPDLLDGCVPVNLFSDSLLSQAIGDFSSQAERDYVFGARNFDTTYEQIVVGGFVTGDVFEMPAGPVGAVFGFEWRKDIIDSTTDFTGANGLLLNFNADKGAIGSKWIREAFAEVDIPLQADKPWVEELRLNLSGRLTDEELYGTAGTFSVKGGWRPVSPLLLRFSYGTSFRAPNLRENFLVGTTGFQTIVDPCAVPDAAFVGGVYDPVNGQDLRDPAVFANCLREGRDPTTVGIDNSGQIPTLNRVSGVEIARIGSLDLDPETSRSITAGFSFDDRVGEWDLALSATYYDVKIKDSVVQLSAQFAVSDCFAREDGIRSQFCDNVFVGQAASDVGLITSADVGFLNLDEDSVRGADFNASIGREVVISGENIDFGLDLRANRLIERSRTFIDLAGARTFSEFTGEFGLPKWTGRATFSAEWEDFLFTWQTRWVGEQAQDPAGVDEFSDAFGFGPDGNQTGFISNTCTGFGSAGPDGSGTTEVAGDGNFCRDVGFADDWFEHAASIRYRTSDFEFRIGVSNIFDKAPPRISCDEEQLCISNTPIGASYNLDGREIFATIRKNF